MPLKTLGHRGATLVMHDRLVARTSSCIAVGLLEMRLQVGNSAIRFESKNVSQNLLILDGWSFCLSTEEQECWSSWKSGCQIPSRRLPF